jgi:hypothetical protein
MSADLFYWEGLCARAESSIRSAYSSTFFARRNISIVDQQSRCFNLCWALHKTRRIRATDHVAIIGGGISGLTCAVALAAWTNCLVSILERDSTLLTRFRRAAHRYIHPDLNHRGGSDGYLIYDPHKPTRFPFMNWSGDYAPTVAGELIRKFEHYRGSLNIALHLNTTVCKPRAVSGGVELAILEPSRPTMKFDAVVFATGFGEEGLNPDTHTNDSSYWLSGNPLSYRASPLRKKGPERVLVSGNGDSAVIEIAQLLIKDFSHEHIFSFLPSNNLARQLSNVYAGQVHNLIHRQIEREYGGVMPWYWAMRELNLAAHCAAAATEFDFRQELYSTANLLLQELAPNSTMDESRRSAIMRQLRKKFDALASIEIESCMNGFVLSKIFSAKVKDVFREDLRVTVTGRSPAIYSTVQAPLNWFLLRFLTYYGAVDYHQTELVSSHLVNNLIGCRFKDRSLDDQFHRVITRHGPNYEGYASDEALRKPDEDLPKDAFTYLERFLPPELFVEKHQLETFNGRRLIRAQTRAFSLDDEPYPGSPVSDGVVQRQADAVLWDCHGHPDFVKAEKLYRQLKKKQSFKERKRTITSLLKLALRGSKGNRAKRRKRSPGLSKDA